MKKIICTIFFLLSASGCFAQWLTEVQLTNDPGSSLSTLNSVAASGSSVHAVWSDSRDPSTEIYYKRSTNSGLTWSSDIRLTNSAGVSLHPAISASGLLVNVVWYDNRDGDYEIYYKRSTDGGINWGSDTRLTISSGISQDPSIYVSGNNVNVVWVDLQTGSFEIFYKKSNDGGITWSSDMVLSNTGGSGAFSPSVSASGNIVISSWQDNRSSSSGEIYYKRSTDFGTTFGTDTRLTNDPGVSTYSTISISGTIAQMIWLDNRTGQSEIFYNRSTNSGLTWGTDTKLTSNVFSSSNPAISISSTNVHVVYHGNGGIYYMRSTNSGITWGGDQRLSDIVSFARDASVSVSGTTVHVIWHDARNSNEDIYYARNPLGNPTGITTISEAASKYSLHQNFPNPFNPTTKINFDLPVNSIVSLKVYNIQGKEISSLVDGRINKGSHVVDWNASNYQSGIYFYKLIAGDFVETRKMILLK